MSPHTEHTDAAIARLALAGMSASQIAVELGAPFTRNSVIGRAHRTGIALSKLVVSNAPKSIRDRELKQARRDGQEPPAHPSTRVTLAPSVRFVPRFVVHPAPAPEPAAPVDPTSHAVDIFGLTRNTCRNPLGPKMEVAVLYCGKPPKPGSPYCAHCHGINYAPRLPPTRTTVDKQQSKFGYLMAAAE